MWDPAASRAQIVKVMNYILDDGRAPRQISFPTQEKPIPEMDLRPYIDQGPWIIETIYSYLAFTGDYSILDEECTYYHAEETFGPLSLSEIKSSILCHMVDIVNYLVSKIDPETFCLRALWGDWNDALDGLGHTKDEGKEFGSGVSVMATEQLYSALNKMIEILERVGKMPETLLTYTDIAQKLAKGYRENAITEESGVKRVLHGWGDKKEYYVGSYNDYDEKSRISLTAHAFAAISGLTEEYPELCEEIVLDFSQCRERAELYEIMAERMLWRKDYGRNLDALYDILTGLPHLGRGFAITLPAEYAPCRDYAEKVCSVFEEVGVPVRLI